MSVAVQSAPLESAFSALSVGRGYAPDINLRAEKISQEEKERRIFKTDYEPSLEWWNANQASYQKPQNDPLPEGFPEQDNSLSKWDGKVLINQPEKWLYTFTKEDTDLLNKAYDHFASLSVDFNEISQKTFPIPSESQLHKALKQAAHEINHGLGLRILRGLPVDSWTRDKQIVIFAGISAYIGETRLSQGGKNIAHLRDITNIDADKRPAIVVKGQTSGNQVFHNDGSAGIVSLITLGVAETGGLSQLSSVAQTYNEFATNRRDILRELAKSDWKNGRHPEGDALIHVVGDQVISSYSRRPFFGFYEAKSDFPPLPTEKHLALDAIHFTAEKFSLDIDLQKGDLEYFNNLTVFHARTSSEDSEVNQRHLIRLWLDNPEQPLPAGVKERFAALNAGSADQWPREAWEEGTRTV